MVAMVLVGGGLTIRLVRSALQLVRARERLRDRAARQTILAELGRRALRDLVEPDQLTGEVLRLARQALGGDLVCYYELRGDGELDVRIDDAERVRLRGTVAPGRARQARAALDGGCAVAVADLRSDLPDRSADVVRDLGAVAGLAVPVLRGGEPRGVLAVHTREPTIFGDEDAAFLGSLANVLAAALERSAADENLRCLAVTDPLTGLMNHRGFTAAVTAALEAARADPGCCAPTVLFLDLDRFKEINDTRGHGVGDTVLTAVAERLQRGLRGSVVARLGGDEFALLSTGVKESEDALDLADAVTFLLAEPFLLDGALHDVSAGIGMAVRSGRGGSAEDLIRDAHTAMYRAKSRGPHERELFDPATRRRLLAEVSMRDDLRRALERRELHLVYQPIVALRGARRLVHVEALLRWQSPTRGLVGPADFIPLAEASGLIVPIGDWVLEEACRRAASWDANRGRLPPLGVSVNISAVQLREPGYWQEVGAIIERTGIDPALLGLELTESALMDSGEFIGPVQRLRDVGCRLFLDDFGTGYSSLSYLRSFPVDVLKIDRSFVGGVGHELGDSAIVAATVSMAHSLGVEVVAEGVETAGQAAHLELVGCDYAQGFHFSRPVTAEQVPAIRKRIGRPVHATSDAA
jgi:diguanylate cyclase (GGDEF)-like protein